MNGVLKNNCWQPNIISNETININNITIGETINIISNIIINETKYNINMSLWMKLSIL